MCTRLAAVHAAKRMQTTKKYTEWEGQELLQVSLFRDRLTRCLLTPVVLEAEHGAIQGVVFSRLRGRDGQGKLDILDGSFGGDSETWKWSRHLAILAQVWEYQNTAGGELRLRHRCSDGHSAA